MALYPKPRGKLLRFASGNTNDSRHVMVCTRIPIQLSVWCECATLYLFSVLRHKSPLVEENSAIVGDAAKIEAAQQTGAASIKLAVRLKFIPA